jgi:hypothetical protein
MNTVRPLRVSDINQVLDLAYKAVYERGWVNTEFDKASFNFRVKSLLTGALNKCFGMFRDTVLVGFVVAQIDSLPWNTNMRCYIDLIHLDTAHRDSAYYQLLFDAVMRFCNDNNIKVVRTSSNCYLLDVDAKADLLMSNGFVQSDVTWEKSYDS